MILVARHTVENHELPAMTDVRLGRDPDTEHRAWKNRRTIHPCLRQFGADAENRVLQEGIGDSESAAATIHALAEQRHTRDEAGAGNASSFIGGIRHRATSDGANMPSASQLSPVRSARARNAVERAWQPSM